MRPISSRFYPPIVQFLALSLKSIRIIIIQLRPNYSQINTELDNPPFTTQGKHPQGSCHVTKGGRHRIMSVAVSNMESLTLGLFHLGTAIPRHTIILCGFRTV